MMYGQPYPSENDKYAGWVKRLGELQLDCFETHYGLKNYSIVRQQISMESMMSSEKNLR